MSEKSEGDSQSNQEAPKKIYYEDLNGERVQRPEGIPFNYKWFSEKSELRTGPLGSDVGEFAGETIGEVRFRMLGKEINPRKHNGIASVYGIIDAVKRPEDRNLIGKPGWFRIENLSKISRRKKI